MIWLHAVTDEDGYPLENEEEAGSMVCERCRTILRWRTIQILYSAGKLQYSFLFLDRE